MLLRRAPRSPQGSPGQLAVGVMVGLTTAGVIAATMAVLAMMAGMQGPVRACMLTASGEVHCGAQTSCSSMNGAVMGRVYLILMLDEKGCPCFVMCQQDQDNMHANADAHEDSCSGLHA